MIQDLIIIRSKQMSSDQANNQAQSSQSTVGTKTTDSEIQSPHTESGDPADADDQAIRQSSPASQRADSQSEEAPEEA